MEAEWDNSLKNTTYYANWYFAARALPNLLEFWEFCDNEIRHLTHPPRLWVSLSSRCGTSDPCLRRAASRCRSSSSSASSRRCISALKPRERKRAAMRWNGGSALLFFCPQGERGLLLQADLDSGLWGSPSVCYCSGLNQKQKEKDKN